MEYEIDLRRYVLAVVRRWPLILLMGLLAAAIAAGWTFTRPTEYLASSSVLLIITETGAQVGTNEPLLEIQTIDPDARRASLSALAQSRAIEAALPPDVVQAIAPANYKPGMFIQSGWLRFAIQGDLLEITAAGNTPENAKALADAWADTFVEYATPLYTDQHSEIKRATSAVLPFEASGQSLVRNTVLAGLFGILLGIVASLLLELTSSRAKLPRRAENDRMVSEPSPTR